MSAFVLQNVDAAHSNISNGYFESEPVSSPGGQSTLRPIAQLQDISN